MWVGDIGSSYYIKLYFHFPILWHDICRDCCSLVLQAIKWDSWWCPSNPWHLKIIETNLVILFVDLLFFHRNQLMHKTTFRCIFCYSFYILWCLSWNYWKYTVWSVHGSNPSSFPLLLLFILMLYFTMILVNKTTMLLWWTLWFRIPFGNFLEDSKADELREFLQSHFQKTYTVNTMANSNNPMHVLIF